MTEEIPERDPENYQFPGQYFEKLKDLDTNSARYSIVQGTLHRAMADPEEAEFSEQDAMEISRLLNRGEIEEAEDQVYQQLEESEYYDRF